MRHNACRSILTTAMILMVFTFSAMMTIPALADGEIPPPPPTDAPTEVAPPPTDIGPAPTEAVATPAPVEAVATNAPVVDTIAPTTDAVATDTPIADTASAATIDTSPTTTDVLSQVPDNTQVVVTDTNGNTLPLASQDAAQALATGDPIWCPNGVAPKANTGGCSASFTTLLNLVTGFVPTGNGTIWITGGADTSSGAISINGGTNWASAANFSLTLKGGWNGVDLSTVTNSSDPSTFSKAISIINWNADVTLNDIVISGAASGNALTISTTKKVTLNRVKVQNNSGSGAKIDNTASGTGTGDVLITFSKFLSNIGGAGLEVDSRGAITLSNVFADGNGSDGANLDNSTAPSAKNVTINTGINEFNSNAVDGLNINSKGAVLLKDITANSNGGNGVSVNNSLGTAQPVTITGTNIFSENTSDGLVVWSSGAISASNLVANDNGGWGAYLKNTFATTAQPVTVSGINEFKYNGGGLYIDSQGAITTSNIKALTDPNLNPGTNEGVYLQNSHDFASNVTMTGTNVITGNFLTGLRILSNGAITLNNITANNNGTATNPTSGWGAYLDNSASSTPKAVTLTGKNTFNNNYSGGLGINSRGAITLNNVIADNNSKGYGAYLDNRLGAGDVMVKNTSNYSPSFSNNGNAGLFVLSAGNITIMDIRASGNGVSVSGDGAYLKNTFGSGKISLGTSRVNWSNDLSSNTSSGLEAYSNGTVILMNLNANLNGVNGALIRNETAPSPQAVTINGVVNNFKENFSDGLNILTIGAITLNNVHAGSSDGGYGTYNGYGAYLDNHLGVGDVTIKGFSTFDYKATGLYILSAGNITLTGLHALSNGNGAYLDNRFGTGNVSLTSINTSYNSFSSGLEVYSDGTITLTSVTSEENHKAGALIHNESAPSPKSVIINGGNFRTNESAGLVITTKGAITISNIRGDTSSVGASLDNRTYGSPLSPQNVTINGTNSFSGNFTDGLDVSTYGAILLNNVIAAGNESGYGANLNNKDSATPQAVTLTGYGIFSYNGAGGLNILTKGAITLNNITADSDTGGIGAKLDNLASTPASPQNVTINGTNSFSGNSSHGLVISTYGAILMSNVTASSNYGYGTNLNNKDSATPKAVTLAGYGVFSNNVSGGLNILTKGTITLKNITAEGNTAGFGASLDNTFGSSLSPQNVTINGINSFSGNFSDGLDVSTYGTILLNRVLANNNGGYGAKLSNKDSTTPKAVTLTGNNSFNANVSGGLNVLTKGAITVNNVTAYYNTAGYGASLDNRTYGSPLSPQNVTINGTNSFSGNFTDGLDVSTYGAILSNNLSCESNKGIGAHFYNLNGSAPQSVTLNGTNRFTYNTSGLQIQSTGTIKVNNLAGYGNNGFGANLSNNSLGAGVSITGFADFGSNSLYGLNVTSSGAISISYLFTIVNGGNGATLDNSGGSGGVTLVGTNKAIANNQNGIQITTNGTVLLNNLESTNNGLYGALIDNTGSGVATPQNVTLTGHAYFYSSGKDGLHITTYGAITINNIYAYCNGHPDPCTAASSTGFGAWLDNCGYDTGSSTCTSAGAPRNITITGYANFESNALDGLWATSLGAISISNLHTFANLDNGVYLNNQWDSAIGGITLTGDNTFESNGVEGLLAKSHGAITLNNVSATFNKNSGVHLDNTGPASKAVTLTGFNIFSNNGTSTSGSGLVINSVGQITLSNITAEGNKADGILIDNTTSLLPSPGIKLTGINTFNKNGARGLYIFSNGLIDLSNITADLNGGDALYALTAQNVTLSCGSLNNNGGHGWNISAPIGTTTLKGVNGFGNILGNFNTAPELISRTCPVPAPVVAPHEKQKVIRPKIDPNPPRQ